MNAFAKYAKLLVQPVLAFGMMTGTMAVQEKAGAQSMVAPDKPTAAQLADILLKTGKVRPAYDRAGNIMGVKVAPQSGKGATPHWEAIVPNGGFGSIRPPSRDEITAANAADQNFPPVGFPYNTPASFACVYGLARPSPGRYGKLQDQSGCVPGVSLRNPSGGYGTAIGLVEDYYSDVVSDLNAFCKQFGLPPADVTIIYADGKQPPLSSTAPDGMEWAMEAAIDTQWAHAMAPAAKIIVVMCDPSVTGPNGEDALFHGVQVAAKAVQQSGGGVVPMSFGFGMNIQLPENYLNATYFQNVPGVTFGGSAGDDVGDPAYPARSRYVIAVGGSRILRDANNKFMGEMVWNDTVPVLSSYVGTGAGLNPGEPRPAFQDGIQQVAGAFRSVPDISLDAAVETGAWIFLAGVPVPIGGTSLAAPILAGIIAAANAPANGADRAGIPSGNAPPQSQAFPSTLDVLNTMYEHYTLMRGQRYFRDITAGSCTAAPSLWNSFTPVIVNAGPGFDGCSGVGSPVGYEGLRVSSAPLQAQSAKLLPPRPLHFAFDTQHIPSPDSKPVQQIKFTFRLVSRPVEQAQFFLRPKRPRREILTLHTGSGPGR